MYNDNEIPPSLIDDFKNGYVSLFVGAGISNNAGLPSWTELLEYLGKSVFPIESDNYKFYNTCNNQEQAQFLYDSSDKITIIKKVRDMFSSSYDEISDSSIHESISSLPISNVITTNWDDLLEDTFYKKGVEYTKVWKDEQLSSVLNSGINIIKLHGTLEDPNSIIFSEDDYNGSYNANPLMKVFLSMLLSRSTILMVGYSYQDTNFKVVYDFVKKQLGENHKKVYALFLNENNRRISYLKSRGLITINFTGDTKKSAINKFFSALNESVSIIADNPTDRLKIVRRENKEVAQRYGSIMLRNMSALGPLGTPDTTEYDDMFGINTSLEIECARNWRSILDKKNSSAKLILCLNDDRAKEVFKKNPYIIRLDSLLDNIEKYYKKIYIVDTGNPLIMNNFDIYGNILFLENIKTNINKMGYGYLKVHKDKNVIKMHIDIFDRIFESIFALNIMEAKAIGIDTKDNDVAVKELIIYRLKKLKEKVETEW